METSTKKKFDTRTMVRVSILGLMGYMLLEFNMRLPIFPMFIKLDVANLPSIIASITMGPVAGLGVEFVKNVIKAMISSETIGIGEISNFICGVSLVIPLGLVYKKLPNTKGYIIGSVAGVLTLCVIASVSNYFFVIPAYALAMGGMDAVINMASAANANITDLNALIVFAFIPFNFIKGMLNVVLGYMIYKFVKPLFMM